MGEAIRPIDHLAEEALVDLEAEVEVEEEMEAATMVITVDPCATIAEGITGHVIVPRWCRTDHLEIGPSLSMDEY